MQTTQQIALGATECDAAEQCHRPCCGQRQRAYGRRPQRRERHRQQRQSLVAAGDLGDETQDAPQHQRDREHTRQRECDACQDRARRLERRERAREREQYQRQ